MQNPFEVIIELLNKLLEEKNNETSLIPKVPVEIIDRKELCKRLSITEPTAIRWDKKGKIPSFNIGSNVRYNWKTVLEKLESKNKGGNR